MERSGVRRSAGGTPCHGAAGIPENATALIVVFGMVRPEAGLHEVRS